MSVNTTAWAAVRDQIAADGHSVDWVTRLDAAGDALAGAAFDLLLLDLMLPDGRGIPFLRKLRAAWAMVTTPSEWPTRITGREQEATAVARLSTQRSFSGRCQSPRWTRRAVGSFASQRDCQWSSPELV